MPEQVTDQENQAPQQQTTAVHAYNPEVLQDMLPVYYRRLFPHLPFYRWLSYGSCKYTQLQSLKIAVDHYSFQPRMLSFPIVKFPLHCRTISTYVTSALIPKLNWKRRSARGILLRLT